MSDVPAITVEDYAGVADAGRRLGSGDGTEAMCRNMAGANQDFLNYALAMHRAADGLVPAAEAADKAKVLEALGQTLASCTACHARYKQEIAPAEH